ncbi:MAG: hypothetical protein GY774_29225 [Planctomycetes bacterium]|nr:hypothetical protein [Planctomycetota bacterium]
MNDHESPLTDFPCLLVEFEQIHPSWIFRRVDHCVLNFEDNLLTMRAKSGMAVFVLADAIRKSYVVC